MLRAGEYDRAIRAFRRLADDPGAVVAGRSLVRTLMEVGRYDDAEREEGRTARSTGRKRQGTIYAGEQGTTQEEGTAHN